MKFSGIRRIFIFLLETLLGLSLLVGTAAYVFHDDIVKVVAEILISNVTGFRVKIGILHHEFPAVFTLQDVTLLNPPGFEDELFGKAPYFYIDIDPEAIVKEHTFHIRHWKMIIDELYIDKNKRGVVNGKLLKSIKNIFSFYRTGNDPAGSSGLAFKMDRLEVLIKRVDYVNHTGIAPKKFEKMKLSPSVYEDVEYFSRMIDVIIDQLLKESGTFKYFKIGQYYFSRSVDETAKALQAPGKILTEQVKVLGSGAIQNLKNLERGGERKNPHENPSNEHAQV